MHYHKVTLVGVGLLGGSLGQALRRRRLADEIVGYVRRAASVAECQAAGAVGRATTDLSEAVAGADLVVLCTPIAQMRPLVEQMQAVLKPGAVITDVGSVKGTVVDALEPLAAKAGAHFVGSHPMAGAEKTGVAHARPTLFERALCVVTPTPRSERNAVRSVEELWESVGARLVRLSPAVHDDLVSRSSHLPHVIAAELVNYVLSPVHAKEQALLCANGFRDATRIASGSPEMWRDIALANRTNLARVLGVFIEGLQEFQHALDAGDSKTMEGFFVQAKERRDRWVEQSRGQASSPE